jgi:tyrosinase
MRVRVDFDDMPPEERQAYTDAVLCLMDQPSQLNPALYPAAVNRYMDYAVTHVNRTKNVHLDAYFLTWHRYYLWLYENDLRNICGYWGRFPYWNWPATADNLTGSAIFDGSEYSMSGDGIFNDTGPIVLAPATNTTPAFTIPHGSGGGCISSGPFAYMETVMAPIPISVLIEGEDLPPTAFDYVPSCLTRDLNTFSAQTWCNQTAVIQAVHAPDADTLDVLLNGVIGGTSLGLHSGAHFTMGSPASNIFVSAMDPIWYPLHTYLDKIYYSWQMNNPSVASDLTGTMTALDLPPSDTVTLQSIEPDWGYFQLESIQVGELISTTAGPFCYTYDYILS